MSKKKGGSVSRVSANLKEIFRLGRNYPWEHPKKYPQCGGYKLWGHGYRDVIFDGFDAPLLLRRWRCPQCTCVLICRPEDYCSRFQISFYRTSTAIPSGLHHLFGGYLRPEKIAYPPLEW